MPNRAFGDFCLLLRLLQCRLLAGEPTFSAESIAHTNEFSLLAALRTSSALSTNWHL